MTNRAWHLMSRPDGLPTMSNFALKEAPLPELQDGWVRVENKWLSVDPYMRGRMNDVKSYVPPFAARRADAGRRGRQGGREPLAASRARATPSSTCSAGASRRSGPPRRSTRCRRCRSSDHQWLGNLGLTGGTAYFGLLRVARGEGGRYRLRLGRGRRGRIGGGADRQGQGHDRDRLGRRRRQMRLGARARRRRGDRLQGRSGA